MNIGDVITTADELTMALDEDDRIWTQGVTGDTPWDRTAWTFASNENGDWWALRLPQEDDPPECVDGVFIPLRELPLPVTVVATSANLPRPERVVKAEAIREAAEYIKGLYATPLPPAIVHSILHGIAAYTEAREA